MEKNGEGKGGKHLKKENIRSTEKKKNIEGKGGKYLKKESIFFCGGDEKRRRKRRKIYRRMKMSQWADRQRNSENKARILGSEFAIIFPESGV